GRSASSSGCCPARMNRELPRRQVAILILGWAPAEDTRRGRDVRVVRVGRRRCGRAVGGEKFTPPRLLAYFARASLATFPVTFIISPSRSTPPGRPRAGG